MRLLASTAPDGSRAGLAVKEKAGLLKYVKKEKKYMDKKLRKAAKKTFRKYDADSSGQPAASAL